MPINLHHSHAQCDECGERHTPGATAECIECLQEEIASLHAAMIAIAELSKDKK